MQKPSTISTGVKGVSVSAATVATTKYSVATAFENKYGDRYAAITVKCDKAFDFYCFGSGTSIASTADDGPSAGVLLDSVAGNALNGGATTGKDGKTFFVPIATMKYVLPFIYQAAGSNAAVTISYQTFND